MIKLCFGVIALVVYGSLWPFNFTVPEGDPYRAFLDTVYRTYSRDDLIENLSLFIPIGFFGLLGARSKDEAPRQAILVLIGGAALGLGLQIAQIYLPIRLADLNDALWNIVGLGLGVALAWLCWRVIPAPHWHRLDMPLIPATLFGAWAVYRLAPFAPSFHLHSLKASLAPLVITPSFDPEVIIHDTIGWLMIAYLITTCFNPSPRSVLIVISSFFLIEVGVIINAITPSEVMAAIIALALWHCWPAKILSREKGLLALVFCLVLVDVIWPLTLTNGTLVFIGPISAATAASKPLTVVVVLAEKIFLYGSCLYLFWRLSYGGRGPLSNSQSI